MEPPALPGVEHLYVDVPGVRVHVAAAGPADAPPLVLLHGWPQHWWCWRHVIPELATTHRVLAADLRGFGWSSAPSAGYEKEQLATDLLALLDAMGLDRVGLVGHDWGAWTGFLAGLRAPERFTGFLALAIPPPNHDAPPKAMRESWRFAYQVVLSTPVVGTTLVRATPMISRMIPGGARQREHLGAAAAQMYARVLEEPPRALASSLLYRTFLMRELPGIMKGRYRGRRLAVRTILLAGADDPAVRPVMLEGVERSGEDLRLEVLPDTGHFVPEERPERVVAAARELFG
jgi:pimeloyl-ACP methyl ester carboxylesterase